LTLAGLHDQADGGPFLAFDIDGREFRKANDVDAVLEQIAARDGDGFTAWLTAPAPIACTSAR
jgi:hypothetical protein